MKKTLHDFEGFLHAESRYPTLIEVGLAHAQFETIHPFLDGNGRVGRLLNTFLLVHRGIRFSRRTSARTACSSSLIFSSGR
jgi:Fic family protein